MKQRRNDMDQHEEAQLNTLLLRIVDQFYSPVTPTENQHGHR